MKWKFFRIIIVILIVAGIVKIFVPDLFRPSTARAVGDLIINWGVPTGDPIFVVENMLPGDTETRDVDVSNGGTVAREVAVQGVKTEETASFAGILEFKISDNGTDIYGGTSGTGTKTLQQFFDESNVDNGLPLSTVSPGDSTTYTFTAFFPHEAGNEYQGARVVFDLIIGIAATIPGECSGIEFSGPAIMGTSGNDVIQGTLGNDLIMALEGDDEVWASLGDDCIIGGPGNDKQLRGEEGKDQIFGNEGDDLIVGANGNDLLVGGDGNDTIRGENNEDIIDGGAGNDIITGGNGIDIINGGEGNDNILGEFGNDIISGGPGNDTIDGGGNNDAINGNEGNDTMLGQSGNDTLLGDADTDSANGHSGTDTCDAETEVSCEL